MIRIDISSTNSQHKRKLVFFVQASFKLIYDSNTILDVYCVSLSKTIVVGTNGEPHSEQ